MSALPLPERMRPRSLDEVVGQQHIVGAGSPLRQAIETGTLQSTLLIGPPGSGKTTLARLIAVESGTAFHELSAVSAGKADVTKVIGEAKALRESEGRKTILFLDEIHRFNAVQQDAMLGAVEDGTLVLIGATTEHPGSSIRQALLSRCRVYRLKELSQGEMLSILQRAAAELGEPAVEAELLERLSGSVRGDARSALMSLEELHQAARAAGLERVDVTVLDSLPAERRLFYDRNGQHHHDTISAFIKSVRGSSIDAALYYLAVMIEGGEDPLFIARRLAIIAAEDIGLADPNALRVVEAACVLSEKVGMPEARIILSMATIYCCAVPKSNSAYLAIDRALATVRSQGAIPPPRHLTALGKNEYVNPHDSESWQRYLPEGVEGGFYKPKRSGAEQKIAEREDRS